MEALNYSPQEIAAYWRSLEAFYADWDRIGQQADSHAEYRYHFDLLSAPAIDRQPYPNRYMKGWQLKNGTPVTIRTIRPEDQELLVKFQQSLSEQTVYLRWLHSATLEQRTSPEQLEQLCNPDPKRGITLVVYHRGLLTEERQILGLAQLVKIEGKNEAEVALVMGDQFQGQGLGTELMNCIVQICRAEKLDRLRCYIHSENLMMRTICRKVGFEFYYSVAEKITKGTLELKHGHAH
jgi:acetyltransferase